MVDDRLKSIGLTGRRLARLTGQDPNTVSRKMGKRQGLTLGPREAGVMACFTIMDENQRQAAEAEFDRIVKRLAKKED